MNEQCPTCGAARLAWPKATIIEAMRAFSGKHGRAPTWAEWDCSSPHHPSRSTVAYRFGSWTAGIRAAGLIPCPRKTRWTRNTVIRAMWNWEREHGQPPRASEWSGFCEEWPSARIVRHRFGTWNRALIAAGLPVRQRTKTRVAA